MELDKDDSQVSEVLAISSLIIYQAGPGNRALQNKSLVGSTYRNILKALAQRCDDLKKTGGGVKKEYMANKPILAAVLLSASVKRFGVSHIQDFVL